MKLAAQFMSLCPKCQIPLDSDTFAVCYPSPMLVSN